MTEEKTTVSDGDQIGFAITVTNSGAGTARNVTVSDPLPTDAGLSWSIDSSSFPAGAGIRGLSVTGVQTCALPISFTVHITSGTTSATAADSPVDNTANVTTTNDG